MERTNVIVRDGKEIELTLDEIRAVYKYQEFEYRLQDAWNQVERAYYTALDAKRVKESEALYSLKQADVEQIAELFIEWQDCNTTENDLWERVVREYVKERTAVA